MGFRKAREAAGLTVLEAARSLKVSPAIIYEWEKGVYYPKGARLPEIALLYNTTIDILLSADSTETSADTRQG